VLIVDKVETQKPTAKAGVFPFQHRINDVSLADPWAWLAAGWRDFLRAPLMSFIFGLIFAGLGFLVTAGLFLIDLTYLIWPMMAGLFLIDLTYLIWPMMAGFILIAPIFCTGFYGVSRRLAKGEKPDWQDLFMTWQRNTRAVLGAGLALVFFMLIWIRTAALIYAINFPHTSLTIRDIAMDTLFTLDGFVFLTVGSAIGAVLAIIVLLVSAVSLQNMVDVNEDFVPAILISVFAVMRNFKAMFLWAILIVLFTTAGLVTAYIGLAVTLPLIGYASWHAYKTVVRQDDPAEGVDGEGI